MCPTQLNTLPNHANDTEQEYTAIWEIQISATSPLETAKLAREMQCRADSEAVAFTIIDSDKNETFVDLLREDDYADSSDPREATTSCEAVAINTLLSPVDSGVETRLVWVVGCDSLTSGSFDWYYDESVAREQFESDKPYTIKVGRSQSHLFAMEVDAQLTADQVTQEVDNFYYDYSQNEEFNNSPLVECYPFIADAWAFIARQYHDAA